MARVEIPHFDLPLRFLGGRCIVVEQDGLRDVQNCVEAILRTHIGERDGLPEFGVPDATFQVPPVNVSMLRTQIEAWEPRAEVVFSESPDLFDEMIDRISVRITRHAAEDSL